MAEATRPVPGWAAPVAEWSWIRLPVLVRPFSQVLSVALGDGAFLRRWPLAGALVPPAALLAGLAAGALHPGPVYSSWAPVLALLALVAGFGAGPGSWAWLGFVLGDWLFADRTTLPGFGYRLRSGSLTEGLLHAWIPLLLAYLLLWSLLAVAPLLATSTRWTTRALLRRRAPALAGPAGVAAHLVTLMLYVPAWAYATSFLIRPLWSYAGSIPATSDIEPLQSSAGWLGLLAVLAGSVRLGLEHNARMPLPVATRPPAGGQARPDPAWGLPVRAGLQVLLLTLLLSGIVADLVQGLLLVAVLGGVVLLRLVVVPRWRRYAAVVQRVPAILRMVACLGVGYVGSELFVQPQAESGERSFLSMLAVVVLCLAVGALLLPGPARPAAAPEPVGGAG
jgi:hypothetical protein